MRRLRTREGRNEAGRTIARGPRAGRGWHGLALCASLLVGAVALAPGPALSETQSPGGGAPVAPSVDGQDPARLGSIELDRTGRSFRVPGTLLRVVPPLEYLAVARRGVKAYESLLELDTGGTEFNAACILIGLAPPAGGLPRFQFDRNPIEGQRVGLKVGWEGESGPVEVDAGRLVTVGGREAGEQPWVYIGSRFGPGNRYLAQDSGTLIGFVHDPISVIEHRDGLGIGAYGALAGNAQLAPAPGTRVWLSVTNLEPAPEQPQVPSGDAASQR